MAENTKNNQEASGTGATDSSMVDALSAKRESLIYASYEDPYNKKESSDGSNNSIVDIISNYTWNNETAATTSELSYSSKMNIPSCFVIEREQTVSSSIMNIVRDANIIVQGGKKVIDALSKLGDMIGNGDKAKEENKPTEQKQEGKEGQAAGTTPNTQGGQTAATPAPAAQPAQGEKQEEAKNENKSGGAGEEMIKQVSGFASKYVANANKSLLKDSKIDGSAYNNGILAPYNFLYATKLTGFKYAFPLLSGQEFYSLTTAWQTNTDNNNSILLNNPITQMLHKGAEAIANTVGADAPNILNVFKEGGETSAKGSVFEMARYFNYNTDDTDEIKIDFVLFNTIAKDGKIDQWKKNLYFIALFNMRNLPFRLDYTTYLPPLLYDVIIPGVKRLPFCYVSSFTATPYGLTRNMQIENFLGKIGGADSSKNTKVNVPIPEAWGISITFKSMLARSANLMLAGGADLPISINMSNNGLQEQLDKEFKASEAKAEKEAEAKRQKEAEEARKEEEKKRQEEERKRQEEEKKRKEAQEQVKAAAAKAVEVGKEVVSDVVKGVRTLFNGKK